MTEQEIINGNKLIAEFEGLKFIPADEYVNFDRVGDETGFHKAVSDLSYHLIWDALMPVVEKIEMIKLYLHNYPVSVNIRESQCVISYFDGKINQTLSTHSKQRGDSETKLLNTWLSVVYFIEWYNTQNQTL